METHCSQMDTHANRRTRTQGDGHARNQTGQVDKQPTHKHVDGQARKQARTHASTQADTYTNIGARFYADGHARKQTTRTQADVTRTQEDGRSLKPTDMLDNQPDTHKQVDGHARKQTGTHAS